MKNNNHEQITETRMPAGSALPSQRAEALATRLENGATALAAFAATLSEAEWQTRLPKDGRKIGVVVHHVASMYPIEIQLASLLAAGRPITGCDVGRGRYDQPRPCKRERQRHQGSRTRAVENQQRGGGRGNPRLYRRRARPRRRQCRSTVTLHSRANSFSRIIRCATVTTISLGSKRHWRD